MLAALAALALAAGCAGAGGDGDPAPSRPVPGLPAGEYLNAAWLTDGTILTNAAPPEGDEAPGGLRVVAVGSGGVHTVALPQPAGCVATEYAVEAPTADDRVTMRAQCLTGRLPDALRASAVVVDPRRPDDVTMLAPLPAVNPLATAWRPGLRTGMVGNSDAACSGLAALDASGPRPAPAPVTLDGRTWRLDEPLRTIAADGGADCPGQGTAEVGTYSRDGRTVFFYASAAAAGRSGDAKRDAPTTLFAADAVDDARVFDPATLRTLVRDVDDPAGTSATGDGRLAVIAATLSGQRGLWAVDTSTGVSQLIAAGRFTSPSISPDGREVVAVRRASADAPTTTLEIYCLVPACSAGGGA